MPYPFAHPAAVLPLARPLGRLGVPSALAIGSVAPDFWYLLPHLARQDTHTLAALAWFCVPAGLVAYLAFHLLLKGPLVELASPRLGAFTPPRLPAAPWHAVLLSLAAGAATHLAWDAATHAFDGAWRHNWVQHASSVAGTAILVLWLQRRLRRAPPRRARISKFVRTCALLCLAGAAAISALLSADIRITLDVSALRHLARTAGIGALQGLAVALVLFSALYALCFQRKIQR